MSDTISFRFEGEKDEWLYYKHQLEKQGITVKEKLSSIVSQEIALMNGSQEVKLKTASRHSDELAKNLPGLSKAIEEGKYHVTISDTEFLKAAGHDISKFVTGAVHSGITNYWLMKIAQKRVPTDPQEFQKYKSEKGCSEELSRDQAVSQEVTKLLMSSRLQGFYKVVESVTVSFSIDIPMLSLHSLTEGHLNDIIQFNCNIIGTSELKLETTSNKYFQEVLVQEPEDETDGETPRIMKVIVHGEDTKGMSTGKLKKIVGFYRTREPKNGEKVDELKKLVIDAIVVQDTEDVKEATLTKHELEIAKEYAEKQPEQYMNDLIRSYCPKIFGRELEKEAILLSMVGGSNVDGYRKESHLMLVGEADTGKSELVKFSNEIANKSSIIDGSNATGVGILFALDEYDGSKILRAGKMILNNGGQIIVDEYDKMPKSEQKKLNQAMEQQRATYNKGGHIGNAECKTTVIAACNPRNERWDDSDTLIDNLPFDASTVSRYDLLIRLRHENSEEQVRAKMKHIMDMKDGKAKPALDPVYMKALINHTKKLKPTFTQEAKEYLINKFVEFTQIEQIDGSLPVQTRQMEGIQRLCEAYAKLTFKAVITPEMVQKTIEFYQQCLCTLGMNVEKGVVQMDLRGQYANKEMFFEHKFKELIHEDGTVSIQELAEGLRTNPKFFSSDKQVLNHIDKLKESGWLFEPRIGVYRRQ